MSTWMKRTSVALGALAALAVAAVLIGKQMGERKLLRTINVRVDALAAQPGPTSLEQGRYLFATRGCADCHGANGAGKEVMRSGAMLVVSPGIAPGANSAVAAYRTEDWVRTLRHGVKPDGRPVMIMPSEDYNRLTDADLAAIIAYVTQLPPAPGRSRVIALPVAVKVMYALGMVKDASEMIDHALAPEVPVKAEVSVAHGRYVAKSCIGCHGTTFSGGKIPGAPPEWPAPARLAPGAGSAMVRYRSPELFMAMLRSGKRPDGSAISPVMPFGSLSQMNDTDLRALHRYLQTLPPAS
ncbi:MAG: c-type cytochrome [Pseudomonadota bacterium]